MRLLSGLEGRLELVVVSRLLVSPDRKGLGC